MKHTILFLSLLSVGGSIWLAVLDFRVATFADWRWRLNWIGRALARLSAAAIIVIVARFIYRTSFVPGNDVAYLVSLAAYSVGTLISLIVLHPAEEDGFRIQLRWWRRRRRLQ